MNYETCKKLKDAEFPFKEKRVLTVASTDSYAVSAQIDRSKDNYVYAPSLEELIEACGDDLKLISHCPALPDGHQWCANESLGKTPTEAVANLYLALNK